MDSGYPRTITWDFPGIGSKVDAAFENYGEKYSLTLNLFHMQAKNYLWLEWQ